MDIRTLMRQNQRLTPFPLLGFFGQGGVFLLLIFGAAHAQQAKPTVPALPRYSVEVLSEMPRASADALPGLNAKGEVAFWKETPRFAIHPAAWKGKKRDDPALPNGYKSGLLCGINEGGELVGWINTSAALDDSKAAIRAFSYVQGKLRLLETLGGSDSAAYGIGTAGQIVGLSSLKDGARHAFVEANGKMTDLGVLPDGKYSIAYAVNAAGDIVGSSEEGGKQWAVMWRKNAIQKLEQHEDAVGSQARAINDAGQIVGYIRTNENETHAFLYEKGKMTDIGTLGDEPSVANSINTRGIIVGASNNAGKRKRAYIYQNATMTDLNTLISADSGFLLQEACRINDAGQILCFARNKDRQTVLVLLTPQP